MCLEPKTQDCFVCGYRKNQQAPCLNRCTSANGVSLDCRIKRSVVIHSVTFVIACQPDTPRCFFIFVFFLGSALYPYAISSYSTLVSFTLHSGLRSRFYSFCHALCPCLSCAAFCFVPPPLFTIGFFISCFEDFCWVRGSSVWICVFQLRRAVYRLRPSVS
jgi:hypothetical protein